ncbi:hypothetical protein Tco_0631599 [Tanacetum coccineum]
MVGKCGDKVSLFRIASSKEECHSRDHISQSSIPALYESIRKFSLDYFKNEIIPSNWSEGGEVPGIQTMVSKLLPSVLNGLPKIKRDYRVGHHSQTTTKYRLEVEGMVQGGASAISARSGDSEKFHEFFKAKRHDNWFIKHGLSEVGRLLVLPLGQAPCPLSPQFYQTYPPDGQLRYDRGHHRNVNNFAQTLLWGAELELELYACREVVLLTISFNSATSGEGGLLGGINNWSSYPSVGAWCNSAIVRLSAIVCLWEVQPRFGELVVVVVVDDRALERICA